MDLREPGTSEALEPTWIHPTSEVEPGAQLALGVRIWRHCHIRSGAKLARGVSVGQGCYVGGGAVIGEFCRIQNGVNIFDGVELEAYVFCGPSVCFTNVKWPRVEFPADGCYLPTRVGRGASIGANSTILPGLRIGRYAMVGAGTSVTRDVPAFAIFVGNPGRTAGWCSRSGQRLSFDSQGLSHCGADLYRFDAETNSVDLLGCGRLSVEPQL
jgi:UDP-2-acetamido-3-amino-2,3-dideoxy-glucuronate N-acetyltransferase